MYSNNSEMDPENVGWLDYEHLLSDWQKEQLSNIQSSSLGVRCLLKMWFNYTNSNPEGSYCNATWDNIYCWPPAEAGTMVTLLCSEALQEIYPEEAAYLEGNAYRICREDGSWSQGNRTNYDECANSFEAREEMKKQQAASSPGGSPAYVVVVVQYLLFIGSLISLLCLVTALGIFYRFRCLRCDRVTVNSHLMIALVIRFTLLVVITEPFVFKRDTSYRDVNMLCKAIILVYLYGTVSSVAWMFIQGLYLNTTLTTVVPTGVSTQRHFKVYYFVGWILPAILMIFYIASMVIRPEQTWCWKGYAAMPEMWIVIAPMMFALLLNLCFLFNIGRIVYRKVQRSRSQGENSQLKATVKATVILFFVLGVNNLLLPFSIHGKYEDAYIILNTFFGSTQGIVVSFLYCFYNPEVHEAIRRSYNRFTANRTFLQSRPRGNRRRLCTFTLRVGRSPPESGTSDTPQFV